MIVPTSPHDSVAELARALDVAPGVPVAIDGRPVCTNQTLVSAGLRVGSRIEAGSEAGSEAGNVVADGPPMAAGGAIEFAVIGGPACRPWTRLGPGRHIVGRAPSAHLRLEDPDVEPHHGVLDVADGQGGDPRATFTQLTGRLPVTISTATCTPEHPVRPGDLIRIGSSILQIRALSAGSVSGDGGGSIVACVSDPWRRVVRRGPGGVERPAPNLLDVPDAPAPTRAPPLTGLIGAGVAAAGAGVMAVVLGQAMFALFAAIGAVASIATWGAGALAARRDGRRRRAAHRTAMDSLRTALAAERSDAERRHRWEHATIVDMLDRLPDGGVREAGLLWARRRTASAPLSVTIGRGSIRWDPPVTDAGRARFDAELGDAIGDRFDDVPIPLTLSPGRVVAVRGARANVTALCRSAVIQLAIGYGPVDWNLVVVADDVEEWEWARWLPHGRGAATVVAVGDVGAIATGADRQADDGERTTVIVVDSPSLLTTRTGPLRRRLAGGDTTCIVLVDADDTVPSVVDTVLDLGERGHLVWASGSAAQSDATWSAATGVTASGISLAVASSAARTLAPFSDPELTGVDAAVPVSLRLGDVTPDDDDDDLPTSIARRWQRSGSDPAPRAIIGMSADGVIDVDLVRDGPHALIAGTTGSGKSELLRTLVVSLASGVGPDHLNFILVDFKGGSTFDVCSRLPHTVGTVTDLDGGLAERVIVSLDAEIRRREELLRAVRCDDLDAYRRTVDEPLARIVVVIDEFATLAKELPDVMTALVGVAQRGRSLGIHLVLATQRPAGVVTDDIRANTNLRIALRVHDRTDACDVVGADLPATFPAGLPGRAALRLGPDDLVVFQTASTSGTRPRVPGRLRVRWTGRTDPSDEGADHDGESELAHLVAAIGVAATTSGLGIGHRPWIDPLPVVLRRRDLPDDPGAVGLLDDPDHQTRRALTWCPADGNVLLVGALGTGITTAACRMVAAVLRLFGPEECHAYVIDGHGDAAWETISAAVHCGGVVRIGETERLSRLLHRLDDEMDRRIASATRSPAIIVVVESLGSVRGALDDIEVAEPRMRFERVVRDGPGLGIVVCATTDGSSSSAMSMPRSSTWVFRVDDPAVARAAGLRSMPVSALTPGRLRVAESGLEGQIAHDVDDGFDTITSHGESGRRGPDPIDVLPANVDPWVLDRLDITTVDLDSDHPLGLVIGLSAGDLTPALLMVPRGDHVFIGGGSRTGRSTALRQVEAAWCRANPDGRVVRVARGGALDDLADLAAGSAAVLVVADDADRIDDPDGRLAALVSAHRCGLTVAVAARLEAVRVAYGHWVRDVARSRCGLIMTSTGDLDGELLGATLPRRSMIPPRPGLAWMVDGRGHQLVQVADRMPP